MKYLSNLFQISILSILLFLVFKSWVFSSVISSGDSWYYFKSMFDNHFVMPYAWYSQALPTGLGGQGFAYMNTYMIVGMLLEIAKMFSWSWELVSKFGLYLAFLLSSCFSSIFFVKKIFPTNKFWIFTPILFLLNTYVLMTVGGGQIITALSYSLVPLVLYTVIKLIDLELISEKRIQYIIYSSLLLGAQAILDLRIAFVTVVASGIYLLISFIGNDLRKNLRTVMCFGLTLLLLALLSAYWLVPMLFFGIDPIQQLGVDYSSTSIVKFLSFAKLENSFGLLHPYWYENIFGKIGFMKPSFLFLPILAFSTLLFLTNDKKLNKLILFFVLIGILGIFLGKGASEPFGGIYVFLFEHVPGFQLFRDSIKWYVLIAISFSMLIPFALQNIAEYLDFKKVKIKSFYIVEILFLIYIIFLLHPALTGNLGGTFKSRDLPKNYIQLNNYLAKDNNYFRTLWMPNTLLFGSYSNLHPQISGRDFYKEYNQPKLAQKLNLSESNNLADLSSVKYIIVPEDIDKEIFLTERKYDEKKYQNTLEKIEKISWLNKVQSFGKIVVFENIDYKDHVWCECDARITTLFKNPTLYELKIENAQPGDRIIFSENFDPAWVMEGNDVSIYSKKFAEKYNSFTLTNENSEYRIFYTPQKVVNYGFVLSLFSFVVLILALIFIFFRKKLYKL